MRKFLFEQLITRIQHSLTLANILKYLPAMNLVMQLTAASVVVETTSNDNMMKKQTAA